MSHERSLREIQDNWPQTLKLYLVGFLGSIILTAISFALTAFDLLPRAMLLTALILLALTQAAVQLIFFMHMGKEAKPRWMTLVFGFMVLVIVIIVIGTLWIMSDLNFRTMAPM